MKLDLQIGLGPGHIVLDEDPAPLPQRGTDPQFSAHICCGQMAAWINIPLRMELGLGPGDFVLDRDPAPHSPKRGRSPQFSVHVSWGQTAGWIKMVLGMEVGLSPADIVLDGDPASTLPKKSPLPNFRPISIVAKRLDGSIWHLAWRWALVQATLC